MHFEDTNTKGYPYALKLLKRNNVFRTEAFKMGWFEVQDASSQLVADFLDVKPGMRVIDACAGAGGKTLQLSSIMKNKGTIIAMDIYKSKLNKLKIRARRNGAHNIKLKLINSSKVIKKQIGKADRVLIDSPCSGMGVLRRNPDTKWKLKPDFIKELKHLQQKIIVEYSKMLKKGGKMVYSTCSVLPSENQNQLKKFLKSDHGKDYQLIRDKIILSSESGYDGFFMALIKKIK